MKEEYSGHSLIKRNFTGYNTTPSNSMKFTYSDPKNTNAILDSIA